MGSTGRWRMENGDQIIPEKWQKDRRKRRKPAHLVSNNQNTGGRKRPDEAADSKMDHCSFQKVKTEHGRRQSAETADQWRRHGVTGGIGRTCGTSFPRFFNNTAILIYSDILSASQVIHCSLSFLCGVFVMCWDCHCPQTRTERRIVL